MLLTTSKKSNFKICSIRRKTTWARKIRIRRNRRINWRKRWRSHWKKNGRSCWNDCRCCII